VFRGIDTATGDDEGIATRIALLRANDMSESRVPTAAQQNKPVTPVEDKGSMTSFPIR
jgi:hypothetical protein